MLPLTPAEAARVQALSGDVRVVRRRFSPLKLRILAVNVLALAILVGGLLYLGRYQNSLIAAELEALATQGRIFAGTLAEGALAYGTEETDQLAPELAQLMVRRLVEATQARTRLFDHEGRLIADSREMAGTGTVQVVELPPPSVNPLTQLGDFLYRLIADWLPHRGSTPPYVEPEIQRVEDYPDAVLAQKGETASMVWSKGDGRLMLTVGVPVQRLKQVLGVVYLSRPSDDIDAAVRSVRFDILRVFIFALAITVLMSIYLAGTIARPIRRLAQAAERVRRGQGRHQQEIPDFTDRHDEIGDLSAALRDMTDALKARITAIERFAADVAHEIKNPLSSLASAVETAVRIDDPVRKAKLMAIIQDDIRRLDRLITDIASASRVDAELSRVKAEPVDLGTMLRMLAELDGATHPDAESDSEARPRLVLDMPPDTGRLIVHGIEDRLVQVFQNLIANAMSFSPPGGTVTLRVGAPNAHWVEATVADQGPGIPEGKLEAIFDRFYSERPKGEKFGTHSGLGLSISRQIVEAHGGRIEARNRMRADGTVAGAVFVVRLPRE